MMLTRTVDHGADGRHLGLAHRRRRLDIDNDRVFQIDQIVGCIGEEGQPLVGTGPARGRIGR